MVSEALNVAAAARQYTIISDCATLTMALIATQISCRGGPPPPAQRVVVFVKWALDTKLLLVLGFEMLMWV